MKKNQPNQLKKPIHQVTSELLVYAAELAQNEGMTVGDIQTAIDACIGLNPHIESINKGYKPQWASTPYPYSMCININDVVCHGVPAQDYAFKSGDTVIFDIGIRDVETGDCGDAALTIGIGKLEPWNEKLIRIAKEALYKGIAEIKPGGSVYAPGEAMARYVRSQGRVINQSYGGHGIGKVMHTDVKIPSHDAPFAQRQEWGFNTFQVGQVYCIEPIVTTHDAIGKQTGDWLVVTKDGRNVAMFEHMVLITETGYEILTTHIVRD